MALIEVFHVVASNLPVDANYSVDIPMGSLLTLNTSTPNEGYVTLANGDDPVAVPVGIAGDTRSSGVTNYSESSARSRNPKTSLEGALVTGAWGASQRFMDGRVSDNYNEVLASGKMTVYHSGGEFWTDQYEIVRSNGSTLANYLPGTPLFASGSESAALSYEPEGQRIGRFTDEASLANGATGSVWAAGVTLTAPTSYPSGVPGTETAFQSLPEGGNSLTWGTFLHVKLLA